MQAVMTSDGVRSILTAMSGEDVRGMTTVQANVASSTGYVFDNSAIMLLAWDIELNPGPIEMEDMQRMLSDLDASLTKKFFDKLEREMKTLREEFRGMSAKVKEIEKSVNDIGKKIDSQMEQIERIEERQDGVDFLLGELNERVEQQEIRDRRDNILLYGVEESEGSESYEQSVQNVLHVINNVLPTPLQANDIVRAHRIGRRAAGKTRPLIARLVRSSDKLAILQKRRELREKNVGVSSDLTTRQREELDQARQEGYFAYYKGGKLHKERRQPVEGSRPFTRSVSRARSGTTS